MFTAQHYIKVAKVLRETKTVGETSLWHKDFLTHKFAEMFQADNPLFDYGLFIDECQPLEVERKQNGN